ncbi:MAG: type II toxin-antitoxin system VapC family toxin [Desulfococcaceae bacterium]
MLMIIFIDTSAWVKFFINEQGTDHIQRFMIEQSRSEENVFAASAVTCAEMTATFRRAWKGQRIIEEEYEEILKEFREQLTIFTIAQVNGNLITLSGNLAETYALKGCDAFQLASALSLQTDVFVSCDEELNDAAEKCGLYVWNPVGGELPLFNLTEDCKNRDSQN